METIKIDSISSSYSDCVNRKENYNNDEQIRQYFVVSELISTLYSTASIASQSDVGSAAPARSSSEAAGVTNVSSIAPIGSTLPANSAQAEMQAAGLLAFINRIIAANKNNSTQFYRDMPSIKWAIAKLKELQNNTATPLGTEFKDAVTEAIREMTIFDKPNETMAPYWQSFVWKEGKSALQMIYNHLLTWSQKKPSPLDHPDNDTMFSIIMLYTDFSQEGDSKLCPFSESFFGFAGGSSGFPPSTKYAQFIAYYLWNESKNNSALLPFSECINLCKTLYAPNGDTPSTGDFIQMLNFYMGKLMDPATNPNWPTDLPFSPIQDIINSALAIWSAYLKDQN